MWWLESEWRFSHYTYPLRRMTGKEVSCATISIYTLCRYFFQYHIFSCILVKVRCLLTMVSFLWSNFKYRTILPFSFIYRFFLSFMASCWGLYHILCSFHQHFHLKLTVCTILKVIFILPYWFFYIFNCLQ